MTIEVLLEMARDHIASALIATYPQEIERDCAIAQAAALTAQAMMAHEQHKIEMMRHQIWIDNTFGEQIDPGEEVDVTVAFAGDIFDDDTGN